MDVHIEATDKKGRAFITAPNGEEAEMTYSIAGRDFIIIDHTGVPEGFRGQGIGHKLLMALVEKARREEFKILPLCPFAKSVFNKEEALRDVLK